MKIDDEGLMKVFSNKVFLLILVIVGILSIGFYKKTEEQVQENSSSITAYKVDNIKYQ